MLALIPYPSKMREGSRSVFNHQATVHTDKTRRIIAMVPDGGMGMDRAADSVCYAARR